MIFRAKARVLILIMHILILATVSTTGAPSVLIRGNLRHELISSPHYFQPGYEDWAWEIWNGRSGSGSGFQPSTPPAALGGARFFLNITTGNLNSPFYLNMPLLFYSAVHYNQGVAQLSLTSGSSSIANYTFQIKSDIGTISLTSQNMGVRAPWVYSDLGDPLGALKLPNTSEPTMTLKYTGELPFGFKTVGYYISDNRCNFIPVIEKIPDEAYLALLQTPQTMNFLDETPSYTMVRSTKKLSDKLTLGILWGKKQAININYRGVDDQNGSLKNQTHGIGYDKINFGLDFKGTLPLKNDPKLLIAVVSSQGQWQKHKREDGILYSDNLGYIEGKAYKFELDGLKLGKASLSGTYHNVSPHFQWVAVRNSMYAHTIYFNSPSNPLGNYYGWRPILDDEFLLRDPKLKEAYLSDISTYFGLQVAQLKLDMPGEINMNGIKFPSILTLRTNIVENQVDSVYYDPISWQEKYRGYKELASELTINNKSNSTLKLFADEQLYNQGVTLQSRQNIRQEVGLRYINQLAPNLESTSQLSKIWRSKEDDGQDRGIGKKFFFNIRGEINSGIEVETSIGYSAGTYTDDLKSIRDIILEPGYTDLSIGQYAGFRDNFNIGSLSVDAKLAGETIYKNSSLPDRSGISLIGYVEGKSMLSRNLTATIVAIGVTGPQKEDLPSNHLSSTVDYQLIYRPFGSKNNSFDLDLTKRYTQEGLKTNWYLQWNIRQGPHTLTFTYGYRPTRENRYVVAGTPWETRYSMPAKELENRPWYPWRDQGIYSDETYENFYVIRWTISF